ncbi:MAG: hypothetical protein ACE5PT_15370 [Gemmatimonadales bacterium]
MTPTRLLVPLRIPELGPSLGKVVSGVGRTVGGIPLDGVRHRLATRILASAGEARRLAAREERSAALAAIGRTVWVEAWEEAVAQVSGLVVRRVSQTLQAEARAVRMPPRKLRVVAPDAGEERALAARLGSAGASLIPALDQLEDLASRVLDATPHEREAVQAWQEALRTAARRLEAAWLAMEEAVRVELGRWGGIALEIAAWRKPLWPVGVVGGVLMVAAVWLGLVLGGYVAPPDWLVGLWESVVTR